MSLTRNEYAIKASFVSASCRIPAAVLLAAALAMGFDRIEGVVVDSATGVGLSNVRVAALTSRRITVTDASGRFLLDGTPWVPAVGETASPELVVVGTRIESNSPGWTVDWIGADGTTASLGRSPLRWDASRLPSGIGWLRFRSQGQEAMWNICRIPGETRVRRVFPPKISRRASVSEPETLFVRRPGGTGKTVAARTDSVVRVALGATIQVAGDFHTHTFLTDGVHTLDDVAVHAFGGTWPPVGGSGSHVAGFGLDWFANSEHGGSFSRDRFGNPFPTGSKWRWETLRDISWPAVDSLRRVYPDRRLFQGLEWNVPSHEHSSVAILTSDHDAIARFEYFFDEWDTDLAGGSWSDATTKTNANTHAKALAGARWLREKHGDSSWFLINHPSRLQRTSIADLRDLHEAGGSVFLGIEAIPGHQKAASRGGYHLSDRSAKGELIARTHGGVDFMLAKVGGVMDALWSEGRRVWVFSNSDFHAAAGGDYYPGEYNKNLTRVADRTESGILAGLRSGATVAVMGDLVDSFWMELDDGIRTASMGGELATDADSIEVRVAFHVPRASALGDSPAVDHLDLIGGTVGKRIEPEEPAYRLAEVATTAIRRTRQVAGVEPGPYGWHLASWKLPATGDAYFRVRGSSMPRGLPGWTDSVGNPLCDDLQYPNDDAKARSNLWFYSNPVFLRKMAR